MRLSAVAWVLWTLIVLTSLYYAAQALPYLASPIEHLRLRPDPPGEAWALRLHAVGGLIALGLGPWQLLTPLRRRAPSLHRLAGYGYVLAVAMGVAGAVVIARTPGGAAANAFAFYALAALWAIATSLALAHAIAKRWRQHQRWMYRSFALSFAAVTLRAGMPMLQDMGFAASDIYTIAAWASWTLNLIVVEWIVLPLCADAPDKVDCRIKR